MMHAQQARMRLRVLLGLLVMATLAAFVAANFRVTTDIQEFLPDSTQPSKGAERIDDSLLSSALAKSSMGKNMILVIEASSAGNSGTSQPPDSQSLASKSEELEAALRLNPAVRANTRSLFGGETKKLGQGIYEMYAPRALSFMASSEEEAKRTISNPELQKEAARLKEELSGPLASLVTRLAPRDPFLTVKTRFEDMARVQSSGIKLLHGRFFSRDETRAIIFLETKASAFDAEAQAPFLEGVDAALRSVCTKASAYTCFASGLNRFATRASSAIRTDIQRVTWFSVAFLAALLFWLFRGLRLLGLAAIPVGTGMLCGCAATLLLFGRIHGLTLAFGASLLGVSIDYVVHLYSHHAIAQSGGSGERSLFAVRKALFTGSVTTLAGFITLAASSLPGLREVSCFASFGMAGAFAATYWAVPLALPKSFKKSTARARFVANLAKALTALRIRRQWLWLLPAFVIILSALVLPQARWNTDLSRMANVDSDLQSIERSVRKTINAEQMRFAVAYGKSDEEALQANERAAAALQDAKAKGYLSGYRNIAPLLPSAATQTEVARVVLEDESLQRRFSETFGRAGFSIDSFSPFLASLNKPPPPPLSYQQLVSSPLKNTVKHFRLRVGEHVAFLSFLEGVKNESELRHVLGSKKNVLFFDQRTFMNKAQSKYRSQTMWLLIVGVGLVGLILLLRYRRLRPVMASLLPSLLACVCALCALSLFGRSLDLVSLTALLMVVSMGVDYGVFLVDASDLNGDRLVATDDHKHTELTLSASLFSILLACVSTLVGFSSLALSEHPVLSSLGLTAAFGMAANMVLAPAALLLAQRPVNIEAVGGTQT